MNSRQVIWPRLLDESIRYGRRSPSRRGRWRETFPVVRVLRGARDAVTWACEYAFARFAYRPLANVDRVCVEVEVRSECRVDSEMLRGIW